MIKTINLRKLIPSLLLPLFLGLISQLFTQNAKDIYLNISKPPLSPPAILFPFIWTSLYILLGISSYIVEEENCGDKKRLRQVYFTLLALNLIWPLVFFTLKWFAAAIVIIVLLIAAAAITLYYYYNCNKYAGYLFLPYFLWILFAAYLNIGIVALN